MHHEFEKTQLNIDNAEKELKNKQFATIIKRSLEWKMLKLLLRRNDAGDINSNATGQALIKAAYSEIEKFIEIVSSK